MKNRQVWMVAVVGLLWLGQAWAQDAGSAPPWLAEYGYRAQELARFDFGAAGVPEVPIITAKVQGSPELLIFDTGTNGYAALDAGVIERLHLPVKSWSTFLDSSGKPVAQTPTAVAPGLEFGPVRLENVEVMGMGPESVMGKRVGFVGTLGWWSLRDYRVTLDYARHTMALSNSPLPKEIKSCATRYVTHFVSPPKLDGLILVEGQVDGKPIYVEVDTGKSSTEIDPKLQALRHFKKEKSGYLLEGIRIGPFEVRSRFGRVFSGFDSFSRGMDKPVHVGVGSDFLKNYLVTIDYRERLVVLEEKSCDQRAGRPQDSRRDPSTPLGAGAGATSLSLW